MQRKPLILCCWPGLAGLWMRGQWSSLFVAVGFSILLNLALVSTFVWPALLDQRFSYVAWPVLLFVWIVSAWRSYREMGLEIVESVDVQVDQDTLFIQAQTQYLKGNWKQAETALLERLKTHSRDIEARLLLATIFRRHGRLEKAAEQLGILGRFDASTSWEFEMDRERSMVERALKTGSSIEDDESLMETSIDENRKIETTLQPTAAAVRLGESATCQAPDQPTPENLPPNHNPQELPEHPTDRKAA